MELYRNSKTVDKNETSEVNWRKFVTKSSLPPKLPKVFLFAKRATRVEAI